MKATKTILKEQLAALERQETLKMTHITSLALGVKSTTSLKKKSSSNKSLMENQFKVDIVNDHQEADDDQSYLDGI